jgi:hypothetical protein
MARWLDRDTIAVISCGDVWLLPLDGKARTRLTRSGVVSALACSKDGRFIFFVEGGVSTAVGAGGGPLSRVCRDGQDRRLLVSSGEWAVLLTASRDRLSYTNRIEHIIEIVSVDLDGQDRQILARFPRGYPQPTIDILSLACDRAGKRVAFIRFISLRRGDNPDVGSVLEMLETQTNRVTALGNLGSGGDTRCSFIGDDELILSGGGYGAYGELRRLQISPGGPANGTLVPIDMALDPDTLWTEGAP